MIGLSYFSGFEPLLDAAPELVDLLEVEPQTCWSQPDPARGVYRVDAQALERLERLPFPKILHGIGFPVGGTESPPAAALAPFREMLDALQPEWVSEHLSFNRARSVTGAFNTGFLLPPRQTPDGVAAAVHSIRAMADQLPVPFAVETGVNYLRSRADEMPDGAFIGEVIERANCGLILDLHNLWCNERNGRQPIAAFLEQIPLDRVWEVHVAGGSAWRGYWLDSHAGAVPQPLLALAQVVIPRLPNLRAIVFELFPEYLSVVGLDLVRRELETLRTLFATACTARPTARESSTLRRAEAIRLRPAAESPAEWEDALGALVAGQPTAGALAADLQADPGIEVLQHLVGEFRASMLSSVLRMTVRLLLLSLGAAEVQQLLRAFWRQCPPQLFASSEATAFAKYLDTLQLDLPYLGDVLSFERAVIATLLDGQARVVTFVNDPLVLLRAIADGRLPRTARSGAFEVEVTPDDLTRRAGDGVLGDSDEPSDEVDRLRSGGLQDGTAALDLDGQG